MHWNLISELAVCTLLLSVVTVEYDTTATIFL